MKQKEQRWSRTLKSISQVWRERIAKAGEICEDLALAHGEMFQDHTGQQKYRLKPTGRENKLSGMFKSIQWFKRVYILIRMQVGTQAGLSLTA